MEGALAEAAQAALEGAASGEARVQLTRVLAALGAWTADDWIVVNPEGPDADVARHRVDLITARVRTCVEFVGNAVRAE